jgi:hypothetical protein
MTSPERERLAAAIARHAAVETDVERIESARRRLDDDFYERL